MTIKTQDGILVNYDHVITIAVYGGILTFDGKTEKDGFEIAAGLADGSEVTLANYLSEDSTFDAMEKLEKWLSEKNDYRLIMRMPEPDYLGLKEISDPAEGSVSVSVRQVSESEIEK